MTILQHYYGILWSIVLCPQGTILSIAQVWLNCKHYKSNKVLLIACHPLVGVQATEIEIQAVSQNTKIKK